MPVSVCFQCSTERSGLCSARWEFCSHRWPG
jgi:hypothetical protein